MHQYVAYAKLIALTNRRCSEWNAFRWAAWYFWAVQWQQLVLYHEVDTLSWFDLTRFCTTVRVSKQE